MKDHPQNGLYRPEDINLFELLKGKENAK